jgi:peptidoglycan/xylan/chitin deacetylase (PgdA/CDA1 family)
MVSPFYHIVSEVVPIHVKNLYPVVSPKHFIADLEFMLKHFIPINVNEIPLVLAGQKQLSKPAIFLSFDDGFKEISTVVAPILLEKGIPATFFVSPAFVDNKDMLYRCKLSLIANRVNELGREFEVPNFLLSLWGNEVKKSKVFNKKLFHLKSDNIHLIEKIANELQVDLKGYLKSESPYITLEELSDLAKKGFAIGAHSYNHPYFYDITFDEQIKEVVTSLDWVKSNIPDQPRIFAFPFTDYGVSGDFYRYFLKDNSSTIDMMFGTAGMKLSPSNKIIQRIPMEVDRLNARQILGGEYLYYATKRTIGKNKMNIPND